MVLVEQTRQTIEHAYDHFRQLVIEGEHGETRTFGDVVCERNLGADTFEGAAIPPLFLALPTHVCTPPTDSVHTFRVQRALERLLSFTSVTPSFRTYCDRRVMDAYARGNPAGHVITTLERVMNRHGDLDDSAFNPSSAERIEREHFMHTRVVNCTPRDAAVWQQEMDIFYSALKKSA